MTVGTGISFADGIVETKALTDAVLIDPTIEGTITLDGNVTMSGGALTNTSQPAFLAFLSATVENVTGDDTDYTIPFDTETYDQTASYDNTTGVFTAPVSGIYTFVSSVTMQGLAAANRGELSLVTSNGTFRGPCGQYGAMRNTAGDDLTLNMTVEAYMDAADTAFVRIDVTSGTKIIDIRGNATIRFSFFSGRLNL